MATAQRSVDPESDVMRPPVTARSPAGTKDSGSAARHHQRVASPPAPGAALRAREQLPATTAGDSLDRAQHALDQAAKTEKRLQVGLKKNGEALSAVKQDLARRRRDLEEMKSQLKVAKKSRKRAAKEFSQSTKQTTTTK